MKVVYQDLPSSTAFRPTTRVKLFNSDRIMLAVTHWGSVEATDQYIEMIENKILQQINLKLVDDKNAVDDDVTVIRSKESLKEKKIPNNLEEIFNQVIKEINSHIYKQINAQKWISCLEVLLIGYDQKNIYWSTSGQFSLFRFFRQQIDTVLFHSDPTLDYQEFIPLPMNSVGLSEGLQLQSGFFPKEKIDQLIILNTTQLPSSIYNLNRNNFGQGSLGHNNLNEELPSIKLDEVLQVVQNEYPQQPIWAGIIQLFK